MKFKNILLLSTSIGMLVSVNVNAVLPAIEIDKANGTASTLSSATPATGVAPMTVSTPATNNANNAALIQTKITAALVGLDDTLVPVTPQTKLATGNVVEYHAYIINNSPERIRNMKVTMPIPANMELVTKPSPEPVYGSNDGMQFNYMPIKLNTGGVVQEAPMSYYKFVRWDIAGLGLNEVAEVKYRVRVK